MHVQAGNSSARLAVNLKAYERRQFQQVKVAMRVNEGVFKVRKNTTNEEVEYTDSEQRKSFSNHLHTGSTKSASARDEGCSVPQEMSSDGDRRGGGPSKRAASGRQS